MCWQGCGGEGGGGSEEVSCNLENGEDVEF